MKRNLELLLSTQDFTFSAIDVYISLILTEEKTYCGKILTIFSSSLNQLSFDCREALSCDLDMKKHSIDYSIYSNLNPLAMACTVYIVQSPLEALASTCLCFSQNSGVTGVGVESHLRLTVRRRDHGARVSCKAVNPAMPKNELQDHITLNVTCEWRVRPFNSRLHPLNEIHIHYQLIE